MPLTVTLEFSDEELDYFRALMRQARVRNGDRAPEQTAAAAAGLTDVFRNRWICVRLWATLPAFGEVAERSKALAWKASVR